MVLAVSAGHVGIDLLENLRGPHFDAIYFLPASLYFFPVPYASLNFGREGAVPTAIWSALLATPDVFISHSGLELVGRRSGY
jgi:hypothetical protein